jgi:hypothetical protein
MMFTTAQLRAAHDALHRLIADGEAGEADYTDVDARDAYDKFCAEIRKRDRRSANKSGQPQPTARRRRLHHQP